MRDIKDSNEQSATQQIFGRIRTRWGRKLPLILQTEAAECGLACLAMVTSYHGRLIDLPSMRRHFSLSLKGITLTGLMDMAVELAFAVRPLRLEPRELSALTAPCILHWDLNHFVVLASAGRRNVTIHDPAIGMRRLTYTEASHHFTGVALELIPTNTFEKRDDRRPASLLSMLGTVEGLKRSLAQIFMLALCLQVIGLLTPQLMQWIVDTVLTSADRTLLVTLTVSFTLLLAVQTAFSWMRSWMVVFLSTHLGIQWTANVFTHLIRLPVTFFDKRHVGDVVSRFESIQTIQRTLTTSFVEAVLDGLMAVTTFALMATYSLVLTSIVLVAVAAYALLRWIAYFRLRELNEEQMIFAARQVTHFLETVRGIQSIKLYGREAQRTARFLNLVVDSANSGISTQQFAMFFQVTNAAIFGIAGIVVTYIGATLAMQSIFSVGMLVAFLAYSTNFTARVGGLIDKSIELRMLSVQVERLADIVLAEPEVLSTGNDARLDLINDAIELKNVSFRYADGEPLTLHDISFRIEAGESVAIVGPSGCGKTTLAKIILGLLIPSEGDVLLGGVSIQHIGLDRYRSMIGTVMHDDQLFAGSISDNVHFFDPTGNQRRVEECARLASVHDEIVAMPMGYGTLIGDMGNALSSGQRQRILLARALYKQPRVLVLDEATSHLDVASERVVTQSISGLKITRISITHRPESIAAADRAISLQRDGRLLQS